jgi:hypothetical protein
LPYSLLAPNKLGEAARDLRQPDNRDLRFRPQRPAYNWVRRQRLPHPSVPLALAGAHTTTLPCKLD